MFVWKFLSMSHIPLERHGEALDHLESILNTFREMSNNSLQDHLLYNKIRQYFDYFLHVWMNGRFHLTEWNFHGINDNTTTNAAKSTNWRFQVLSWAWCVQYFE